MFLVLYCADRLLVRMIRSALEDTYRIRHVATEARLEALLRSKDLLAVILDGGVARAGEWCRRIRAGTTVPLLAIAAGDAAAERTKLLQMGADDVVSRPFSREELRVRLHAKLRRANWEWQRAVLSTIPQGRHGCSAGRSHIHLTPAEAHLLSLLQQHAGSFVALDELRQGMWDEDAQLGRLRYHICQLRRRLAAIDERVRIETRRGTGYRLVGRGVAVW